jgi:hypothetical protein
MSLLSLRWRLIWSLILLQVVVGLLVMGGFLGLAWALGRVVDETGQETVAAIQRALVRGADGKLSAEPTPELQRLQQADPPFWFIVRDGRGAQLRHGARCRPNTSGCSTRSTAWTAWPSAPSPTAPGPRPASSAWTAAPAPSS